MRIVVVGPKEALLKKDERSGLQLGSLGPRQGAVPQRYREPANKAISRLRETGEIGLNSGF